MQPCYLCDLLGIYFALEYASCKSPNYNRQWINAHPDGDIHTSVRIGRERPGDSTSINGLFVKEPFAIEKGDVIAQIPWD